MSAKPKITGRGTRDWQELDARHYLHPFTDFRALAAEGSRVITRAEGVHLYDSEGQKILDGMSGLWLRAMMLRGRSIATSVFRTRVSSAMSQPCASTSMRSA